MDTILVLEKWTNFSALQNYCSAMGHYYVDLEKTTVITVSLRVSCGVLREYTVLSHLVNSISRQEHQFWMFQ